MGAQQSARCGWLIAGKRAHRQVTDLHLANLAAAHGAVLVTFGRRLERSLVTSDQRWVHTLA